MEDHHDDGIDPRCLDLRNSYSLHSSGAIRFGSIGTEHKPIGIDHNIPTYHDSLHQAGVVGNQDLLCATPYQKVRR